MDFEKIINNYKSALLEIDELINEYSEEGNNKISAKFLSFIKEKEAKEFIDSEDEGFSREAKIIMSMIYRSYFCSKEKQIELAKSDDEELKAIKEQNIKQETVEEITEENTMKINDIEEQSTEQIETEKVEKDTFVPVQDLTEEITEENETEIHDLKEQTLEQTIETEKIEEQNNEVNTKVKIVEDYTLLEHSNIQLPAVVEERNIIKIFFDKLKKVLYSNEYLEAIRKRN